MKKPAPDTKTALLHAALACFAERGFDGASMRMIADRAQRPLSLLSHHFGNKDGLYLAVFEYLFETTFVKQPKAPIPPGGHIPRDKQEAISILREQIHLLYRDVAQDPQQRDPLQEWGSQVWMQEIRSPRPALHPVLMRHIAPLADTVKSCIQVLRPDLTAVEVSFLGASVIGQVACHGLMFGLNQIVWGHADRPGSQFQTAEWLVDLALNGLLGSAPPA